MPELNKTQLIKQILKRKSPLGYDETVTSEPDLMLNRNATTGFNSLHPPYIPSTVYKNEEVWNDPYTQTHERIHQGQLSAGDNPNPSAVIQAILSGKFSIDKNKGLGIKTLEDYDLTGQSTGYGRPNYELPAYQFEQYNPDNQQAYNNYINLLTKLHPDTVHNIKAPMPIDYQKNYLNSGPSVDRGLPDIPEESIMELIKASLFGRNKKYE